MAPNLHAITCMEPSALADALKKRTKRFALEVIGLCNHFPRTVVGYVVARQLIKAATGAAANYRAACRSRSPSDFASRISVVSEEADESEFWLEITTEAGIAVGASARKLLAEAGELTAIFTASRDTAKRNLAKQKDAGSTALTVFLMLAMLAILAVLAIAALQN